MERAPDELRFAVLATDVVLCTVRENRLFVRLIKVNRPPHFMDSKGMPGGLIRPEETAEDAVRRLLRVKARVEPNKVHIEQLYTFSDIDRDPRGRVVAVAYLALVPWERLSTEEQADTPDVWWSLITNSKKLAYDHTEMLRLAVDRLRSRITYTTLLGKLMPEEFTLTELEKAYESILHADLDKRNFRKKIKKLDFLEELPRKRSGGKFRPAQLYRFRSEKIVELEVL